MVSHPLDHEGFLGYVTFILKKLLFYTINKIMYNTISMERSLVHRYSMDPYETQASILTFRLHAN